MITHKDFLLIIDQQDIDIDKKALRIYTYYLQFYA